MFFTVHEWRGGNDSRATFIALAHIVAVTDDMASDNYPTDLKCAVILSSGDRVFTLEPLAELVTRLKAFAEQQRSGFVPFQHDREHAGQLSTQNS